MISLRLFFVVSLSSSATSYIDMLYFSMCILLYRNMHEIITNLHYEEGMRAQLQQECSGRSDVTRTYMVPGTTAVGISYIRVRVAGLSVF